jgi:hypothetical protein
MDKMDRIKSGFQTLLQTLTVVLWGSYFSMSLFHKNFYNQVLSCTLSTKKFNVRFLYLLEGN